LRHPHFSWSVLPLGQNVQDLVNHSSTSPHKPADLNQLKVQTPIKYRFKEGSMSKRLILVCVSVWVTLTCVNQTPGQDYRRFELYGGFSHNRVDVGPVEDFDPSDDLEFDDIFDEREGFNGFEVSVTGNFHRYWGAKFDYSYHQKSFNVAGFDETKIRIHNILGGIQIKDNSTEGTLKPFAHALVGVGRTAADLSQFDNTLADFDDSGFAAAIGGGLDIRLSS